MCQDDAKKGTFSESISRLYVPNVRLVLMLQFFVCAWKQLLKNTHDLVDIMFMPLDHHNLRQALGRKAGMPKRAQP